MKTRVKAPDGTYITVNHPEGATQDEIISYAKQNYKPPAVPRETAPVTPGSEPLSYTGMMKDSLGNTVKSALTGGLLSGGATAAMEGMKNFSKLMERGGYKGGGAVTDALAPHVSPEVAAGAGYATNVGIQAIPTVIGGMVGNKVVKPAMEWAGKKVMHSALKPTLAELQKGNAERAINTLLEKGVNVTSGGAQKLAGMADDLTSQVDDLISGSNATVTKSAPSREVLETIKKFRNQVNPTSDINAIVKSWDDFTRRTPNSIPIQQAQALKQGTYKALDGKFGEVGSAATEAQKALARGLRKAIEKEIPAVGPLNKQASDLLNALKLVERRAGIAGNRDVFGIAPAAMNPQAAIGMLADRSQLVKSLLARALYSGAGPTGTAIGAGTGAVIGNQQAK